MSKPYHIADEHEAADVSVDYDVLIGPDGYRFVLGEPEDRTWSRDGRSVVARLNEQHAEIERLTAARAQPVHLAPGTIVQVVKPAKDGTRALMGMLGVVARGKAPEIPDPNGAHVTFKWHDGVITGAIARDRLRVVGETDPPVAADVASDPDDNDHITVADPAELRESYRKALDIAEGALDLYGVLFARFNTLRESAGLALDGGDPAIAKLRKRLAAVIEQVKPGEVG